MNRKIDHEILCKNMEAERASKILAKSLYKEFISNGFTNKDIFLLFDEMFNYMASDIRKQHASTEAQSKDQLRLKSS